MSFILQNYSRTSVSYNKDSFAEYNYVHPTDTIAEISADDYFIRQQSSLSVNDIITAKAVDGLVSLQVITVSPGVTTVVVIQSMDENGNVVFNTLQLKNLNGGDHLVSSITSIGQEPLLKDTPDLIVVNGGIASGPSPEPTAVMQSNTTLFGWLPPRMTEAQRDAIAAPAEGLIIFNVTTDTLNVRAGGVWKTIQAV